ncbi:MAG: prepilin-type N-terminal cleavage/methylation domain-containing protein [Rickettsiales bacterium]
MSVSKRSAGFSLLELAVVLTIVGSMAGGMLALANKKIDQNKYDVTIERMNAIDKALTAFSKKGRLLPCPASTTAAPNTANFGVSDDCTAGAPALPGVVAVNTGANDEVWMGIVPTRTLNLPDDMMYDGWGDRIRYSVIKNLASSSSNFSSFLASNTTGGIQIMDGYGNQVLPSSNESVVAYVLVSYGKDSKGAINRSGAATGVSCPASSTVKSEENCDNDAVFNDASYNDGTVAAQQFDDIVRWKPLYRLQSASVLSSNASSCRTVNVDNAHLSQGYQYSCAIDTNGELYCWGNNFYGQTGNGTTGNGCSTATGNCNIPTKVGTATDWKAVDGDFGHTCGIRGSGELYCWGNNSGGQLGQGNTAASATPILVDGQAHNIMDWAKVSVDADILNSPKGRTCALRSNGEAYCWGENSNNEIGDGTTTQRNWPTKLEGEGWTDITASDDHACGIRCGHAYCWGNGANGRLGNGSTTSATTPTEVSGGYTDWISISADGGSTCGIRSNGRAYCWGQNGQGQLGDNTLVDKNVPTEVYGNYADWVSIIAGGGLTCGIRNVDQLYCWGNNQYGAVGNSTSPTDAQIPALVAGSWQEFDTGGGNGVCAIKNTDSKAYCWGRNLRYDVGDNTTTQRNAPRLVNAAPLNF